MHNTWTHLQFLPAKYTTSEYIHPRVGFRQEHTQRERYVGQDIWKWLFAGDLKTIFLMNKSENWT